MHYIRTYLLAVLLLLAGNVAAQDKLYLEPRLGFGTFQMKSMKELQQTIILQTNVNAQATDEFTPYFQFGLGFVRDVGEQTRVGVFVERGSTGGRVHYEDYSGEIRFDTPVNYNAVGLMLYSHKTLENSKAGFVMGLEGNVFFSQLKTESFVRIYDESDTSEDKFTATGLGLKPYLGLQYPVYTMPVRLSVGYLVSVSQPFHEPGEPEYYLVRNSNNDKLEPNWSGLRISLTVTVPVFN